MKKKAPHSPPNHLVLAQHHNRSSSLDLHLATPLKRQGHWMNKFPSSLISLSADVNPSRPSFTLV